MTKLFHIVDFLQVGFYTILYNFDDFVDNN